MHKIKTKRHIEAMQCDRLSRNVNFQNRVFVVAGPGTKKRACHAAAAQADTITLLQLDSRLKRFKDL